MYMYTKEEQEYIAKNFSMLSKMSNDNVQFNYLLQDPDPSIRSVATLLFTHPEQNNLDQSTQRNQATKPSQQLLPATVLMLATDELINLKLEEGKRYATVANILVNEGRAKDFKDGLGQVWTIVNERARQQDEAHSPSDARRAKKREYNRSPAGRASQKKYKQSPAGKAIEKKYRQSDLGRATQLAAGRAYSLRKKAAQANQADALSSSPPAKSKKSSFSH